MTVPADPAKHRCTTVVHRPAPVQTHAPKQCNTSHAPKQCKDPNADRGRNSKGGASVKRKLKSAGAGGPAPVRFPRTGIYVFCIRCARVLFLELGPPPLFFGTCLGICVLNTPRTPGTILATRACIRALFWDIWGISFRTPRLTGLDTRPRICYNN